ncbi:MAG: hypothetical protein KZQ73_06480, partial [Candidatus Thiodiazotropha sp. (ex Semelilucina semeliformis)]|nr:hypothetical protein [Candidatus Thiodiazotropha sp. (ex Semelilucina semeliformis)]
ANARELTEIEKSPASKICFEIVHFIVLFLISNNSRRGLKATVGVVTLYLLFNLAVTRFMQISDL